MNGFTTFLFATCLVAGALSLPVSEQEASPSKPVTRIHLVEDADDAARKMYYEMYLRDRNVDLQHSANAGRGVNVEVDYQKDARRRRSAGESTTEKYGESTTEAAKYESTEAATTTTTTAAAYSYPTTTLAPPPPPAKEEAEEKKAPEERNSYVGSDLRQQILASIGARSQKVFGGASYGRKRRAAPTEPPKQPAAQEYQEEEQEAEETYENPLARLGIKSTPVSPGASYGRKRRAAPTEPPKQPAAQEYQEEDQEAEETYENPLARLGIKSTPISPGASYSGKRKRSAMEEEDQDKETETYSEATPKEAEEVHSSGDSDVLEKIAMAYMLQAGDKPKPRWTPGASYGR